MMMHADYWSRRGARESISFAMWFDDSIARAARADGAFALLAVISSNFDALPYYHRVILILISVPLIMLPAMSSPLVDLKLMPGFLPR